MTGEERIQAASRVLAAGLARQSALSPRQAAEEAHRPGGPTVEQLEARIREQRAQASRGAA